MKQIVAIGGGWLSEDEPRARLLDDYVLGLAGKERPRACCLGTASGDDPSYHAKFMAAFPAERAEASILDLFHRTIPDVRGFLLDQDVIYVGGGNTANMLAIWRLHGVEASLREAWEAGVVLAGVSAGAICWFEACLTDSFGRPSKPMRDGLGFLPGSCCPHYDGEDDRRPAYRAAIADGLPAGYAVDDYAALHFVGTDLFACVACRPRARCYRVEESGREAVESVLPTRLLRRRRRRP